MNEKIAMQVAGQGAIGAIRGYSSGIAATGTAITGFGNLAGKMAQSAGAALATGAGVGGAVYAGGATGAAAMGATLSAAAPLIIGAAVVGGGIWGLGTLLGWFEDRGEMTLSCRWDMNELTSPLLVYDPRHHSYVLAVPRATS